MTRCGDTTLGARATLSRSISVICAKNWKRAKNPACCTPCAAWVTYCAKTNNMSLRSRLTLFYTVVLGAILILFGLGVYGLVSVVQFRQIDTSLDRTARDLIDVP